MFTLLQNSAAMTAMDVQENLRQQADGTVPLPKDSLSAACPLLREVDRSGKLAPPIHSDYMMRDEESNITSRPSKYRSSLRLTRCSALSMDFTCRRNSMAISW